jgi:regulator of sigma E protease
MNWIYIFVGFCLLIMLHEAGHYAAAKATGMRVERFFLFFGPTIWSFRRGETEYGVKSIPLGGYVRITGMNPEEEVPAEVADRAYYRQPVWKRIVVIGAGPAVNIVLAFLIFLGVFFFAAQRANQTVGTIRSDTPAEKKLQPGDRIVSVDGHSFSGQSLENRLIHFGKLVASHECAGRQTDGCIAATPATLEVKRDGRVRTISVRPEYSAENKKALIGFSYGSEREPLGLGAAAGRSLDTMWLITSKTGSIFAHIFESKERKQISGIVGTSDVANQTIDVGLAESLLLLAVVSFSLGLINLLPILPLDGGHIFWSLIEKVRGERVSLRAMERASVIGFALVATLFFIGLSNDIGRLTGEGFNVR